jgi:acetyl-CoA C-acetyltransferase
MTRQTAEKYGLPPIATLLSAVNAALEPRLIAAAPAPSIEKAVSAANLTLDDIDLIEINEAFAAMPLVSTKY